MSSLVVYNTLAQKKESFVPVNGQGVLIYACGPTVYDLSHLGHARMAIVWDVIQRYLRYAGYEVTFVRNITDIDDKIIKRAREMSLRPEQVAREYIFNFWQDMRALNIQQPDVEPRATEFIQPMIDFVQGLLSGKHAYVSKGDVYFDVSSFKEYGKLKQQALADLMVGAREEVQSHEILQLKRSPLDFALWKSADANEAGWDSPWGRGRPGWHLECSTMIRQVLGETIDIHGGGEDLVFPHHENEIAQSESLNNKPLARYWIHHSFVRVNAEKMSKSLGNFSTIQDLLNTYTPETIRLFILQTHYRSPIEFSEESINAARQGLQRLIRAANAVSAEESLLLQSQQTAADSDFTKQIMQEHQAEFTRAMDNDFNTAQAIAVLFALADKVFQEGDPSRRLSYIYALQSLADVLGFTLADTSQHVDSDTAVELINLILRLREESRARKDYATSDLIRDRLSQLGVRVMDASGGVATWEKVTG